MILGLYLAWIGVCLLDGQLQSLRLALASDFLENDFYEAVLVSTTLGLSVGLGSLPRRIAGAPSAPGWSGVVVQAALLAACATLFLTAPLLARWPALRGFAPSPAHVVLLAGAVLPVLLWALLLARTPWSTLARVSVFLSGMAVFVVLYPEPPAAEPLPTLVQQLRLAMPIFGLALAIGLLEPQRARQR